MGRTEFHLNTKLLHGSTVGNQPSGATVAPIFQNTAFAYETAEELEAIFAGRDAGYVYSRMGNPTVTQFERRVTSLENGLGAVACASGCALKPTYLLLAFLLVRLLWRADGAPLRLIRHGLVWFFVGEVLCAANFYLHRPGLLFPIELLHGLGMVAMSMLVPWGLWRLADERVVRFNDPDAGCALQRLCGTCWKREPARCGAHDLMIPLVVGLALLALMPLTAPLRPTQFSTVVFGSPAGYGEPIVNHLVELRLYPVLGAVGFLATLPFLILRGRPGSLRRLEPLFFAAVGLTLYPVMRHLLVNAFREALQWSDFWEEITELFAIVFLGVLAVLYRERLGLTRPGRTVDLT